MSSRARAESRRLARGLDQFRDLGFVRAMRRLLEDGREDRNEIVCHETTSASLIGAGGK